MRNIVKTLRWQGAISVLMVTAALLTGCSKNEIITKSDNAPGFNSLKAATNTFDNANAAFDGYVRAFVVNSGSQTYVVDGLNKRDRAYFWGQAFMITSLIDGYERNPTASRKQLVTNLLNTFLTNETQDWSWNSWTDDIAWACIATMRGYKATGNSTFLTVAKNNWDFAYHRGWDNSLGGGLWENMDKHTKASLANNPMIISGILIYEATRDVWYLDRCKEIYAWFRSSGIYDTNTGVVNEAKVNDGSIQYSDHPYNAGSFVNAAASLYKNTGDAMYLNDAIRTADHVKNKFPIFTEEADGSARGIAKLARENGLQSRYYPWLASNCASAWNHRRTDFNITNNNWTVNTATGEQYAMECASALTIMSVTPEQNGSTIANGTYRIINRQNGFALDAYGGGTANNTAIDVYGYNGGNNQKWNVTNIGNGLYKIIGVGSGRSLNVSAGSNNDNTPVILWDYNNSSNENVYLYSPANGYFTIFFSHSNKALDVKGDNSVIQWYYNGGNNQQWQFVAI